MPTITPDSLMTLEAYAKARKELKPQVMAHRRLRSVPLGEHMTVQFEDERTIITEHTVNPRDYYQYSTSLVNGTLTINNGTGHGYASQLTIWVVDGNLIVDGPDYTKNVVVSTSQDQERVLPRTTRLIKLIQQFAVCAACDHDQGGTPGKLIALALKLRSDR